MKQVGTFHRSHPRCGRSVSNSLCSLGLAPYAPTYEEVRGHWCERMHPSLQSSESQTHVIWQRAQRVASTNPERMYKQRTASQRALVRARWLRVHCNSATVAQLRCIVHTEPQPTVCSCPHAGLCPPPEAGPITAKRHRSCDAGTPGEVNMQGSAPVSGLARHVIPWHPCS